MRVLEIEGVKPVPYAPVSHPFVERLIGTIRREWLDRVFFFSNAGNRARKLEAFREYYDGHRVHRALVGYAPAKCVGAPSPALALDDYAWQPDCRGLFHTPIAA